MFIALYPSYPPLTKGRKKTANSPESLLLALSSKKGGTDAAFSSFSPSPQPSLFKGEEISSPPSPISRIKREIGRGLG